MSYGSDIKIFIKEKSFFGVSTITLIKGFSIYINYGTRNRNLEECSRL